MLDVLQLRNDIQALDKGDETSCRQALQSLKHHEAQEWASAPLSLVHCLVKSLRDRLRSGMKRPFMRHEAVTILGNIGPRSEPAIPQLIAMLQPGIPASICRAAATALGRIGKGAEGAVDQLIVLLSNGRAGRTAHALRALGAIGCADQRVRTALGNLWLSASQLRTSQVQVAVALCKLHLDARGLLGLLTTTLVANQDASLRKLAAEALGWRRKNEGDVVPALLTAALQDKKEEVRQAAEAALSRLGLPHETAIRLCSQQLRESGYAETALRTSGGAAVPALVEALRTEEPRTREKAARILGCIGEAAACAAPVLTYLFHDIEFGGRFAAGQGLFE